MDAPLDSPKPPCVQPGIKGKNKVKTEPSRPQSPKPSLPVVESSQLDINHPLKETPIPHSAVGNGAFTAETEAENSSMDVEEEEDVVVKEFDIYINHSLDADTKLYCMQYPLRPSWRPYELDENLQEIRIKPKLSQFEIDLSLNVNDNENYDKQVDDSLVLPKQTLSTRSSPANEFAVGFLIGNQFHLNPLNDIVQFLPLLEHEDYFQVEKQGGAHLKTNLNPVKSVNEESLKASNNKRKTALEDANAINEHIDANEPWVLLEYHSIESPTSCSYKEKAVAEERNQIQFAMDYSEYISSYGKPSGPIWNFIDQYFDFLLIKPLELRLKQWFSEVQPVNRFSVLLHLAPIDSVDDVLIQLKRDAYLVQGLWVLNSSLLCHGDEALYRDYILLQFSKNRAVHESKLNIANTEFKRWLKTFAVRRPLFKDWKFKEDPDTLFIKNFPRIANDQAHNWSICEKKILTNLFGAEKSIPSKMKNSTRLGISSKTFGLIEPCHNKERNNVKYIDASIPTTGQDALAKAIIDLLCLHKVLSLNSIIQGLQEKVNADLHEIESVASRIAIKLHDVYVLKSSGKPTLDPFRNFVIEHLNDKGRNAKLKKKEIKSAAQVHLQKDVSDADYSQNMNDGLGLTGYEGVFLKVCEITLSVLRAHRETLMSVLETFIHDPLVEWTKSHKSSEIEVQNPHAQRAISNINARLEGVVVGVSSAPSLPLAVDGQRGT